MEGKQQSGRYYPERLGVAELSYGRPDLPVGCWTVSPQVHPSNLPFRDPGLGTGLVPAGEAGGAACAPETLCLSKSSIPGPVSLLQPVQVSLCTAVQRESFSQYYSGSNNPSPRAEHLHWLHAKLPEKL